MPRQYGFNKEQLGNLPEIQHSKFAESVLNGGMDVSLDPVDLPLNTLQLARNCFVREDRTLRRYGSTLFTPLKPNTNSVLKFAAIKKNDGIGYTFRFTPTTIHRINVGAWVEVLPDAIALTGTILDRFNAVIALDNFVFSNNGADPIQMVDFATLTYKPLGNAPNFRYICGFFNRVVGAALRGTNEVLIGWSGDGPAAITEWDNLVDETAGEGPLVDSPADLSDYITGLFAWTNVMVVLREKSVWVATKQPIPHNPFNFHAIIPGIGCDCPYSATNIGDGLAWFDRRTREIYAFSPGGTLERIGGKIKKEVANNVDDPDQVFAGFDPINNEYSLNIRQASSNYVMSWTFNRNNPSKPWVYNEYYDLTSVDNIDIAAGGLTIDELGITDIEFLEGSIDDLSPTDAVIPLRIYGFGDGSASTPDVEKSIDAEHTDFVNGVPYTTEIISKAFSIPEDDIYIAEIVIEVKSSIGGTFRIEYSRTGGEGVDSWILGKEITPNIIGRGRLIKYRKMIRCRKFAFRLISAEGLFDIQKYEIYVYKAGKSHR